MDFIKSLLSDFDISSLLPKLDSLLSKVELLARIVVMAGPVILLVLGLWYLLLPPKEANYAVGYRFFWGMSSVESWRFTQLVAGIVWCVLGLLLSLVMYLLSGGFQDKPLMDIVWKCVEYVFWEMGLLAVSCLIINLTVVFTFNSKGDRRREKKNKGKTDAEVVEEEVKRFVHDVNEKLHQKPSLDKVKAAGAALLHKKEAAPLPPAQQVQAMPALEQPAEAVDAAEPVAVPMVEEIPAAQEAPVEEAAAQEAPVVLPVAAPVVEASAAEVPAPAEETSAAQEIPAAQETEPVEEKPSVLDKIKAFFASLADKSKDLFTSFAEKVKGLFASMKSKKKDEEPAAEETPEVSAEETAQEIPAEEPVETPVEETPEEAVEETAEEAEAETAEETPEQSQLPLIVPPSQQRKNPYGTKKRYPKGTKKKGKK